MLLLCTHVKARERGGLVVEEQGHEGRTHRVQALPVAAARLRAQPSLEHPSKLSVSLFRAQEVVVLVAPSNILVQLNVDHRGQLLCACQAGEHNSRQREPLGTAAAEA